MNTFIKRVIVDVALVLQNLIPKIKILVYKNLYSFFLGCLKTIKGRIKRSFNPLMGIVELRFSILKFNFTKIKGFSLLELMFALVALSVALAAFSPMLARRLDPTVQTASSIRIKTEECKTLIAPFCTMCENASECLNCELTQYDCPDGKSLNYQKCKCQ